MNIARKLKGLLVMVFAITACLMLNAATANAAGKMYVLNADGGVTLANLDGTGADFISISGQTQGIAIDTLHGKMYATIEPDNRLLIANPDGTGQIFLEKINHEVGRIAVDPVHGKVYMTTNSYNTVIMGNLDGTSFVDIGNFNNTLSNPGGIALDIANGKIYVGNCDSNTISVANLDGTGGQNLGNLNGTVDFPWDIALDTVHGKIYSANYHNGTVSMANLDGTGGISLGDLNGRLIYSSGGAGPTGIAVDATGGMIYVTNEGVNNDSSVVVANLDGTGGTSLGNLGGILANSHEVPLGIALDIYYNLTVSDNPAAGGGVALSAQGPYQPNTQVTLTANPATGYQFTGWSGDAEGTQNPLTVTVNKDMSITANFAPVNSPVTTAAITGTAGNDSWYVSNVNISLTATGSTSGIKAIHVKVDNSAMRAIRGSAASVNLFTNSIHTVVYYAVDNAGNLESPHTLNINIDKTAPVIKITGVKKGAFYILGRKIPTLRYTVTDKLSGVASQDAALAGGNANHAGIFTYTVNASDNAGNTAVKATTYSVRYVFSGFLPRNGKKFTAGSAVSVQFQLRDAKKNYIPTAYAALMLRSPSGTEVTPTSGTNTGNVFQYDPTTNRYIYNLNTVGLAVGRWRLQVMLDDGSPVKTTYIRLK